MTPIDGVCMQIEMRIRNTRTFYETRKRSARRRDPNTRDEILKRNWKRKYGGRRGGEKEKEKEKEKNGAVKTSRTKRRATKHVFLFAKNFICSQPLAVINRVRRRKRFNKFAAGYAD